ncbi:MAG: preprotein translocase subunit SecE [Bacteroidales bacterium]
MKITHYLQESYKELVHKVSWPTWGELTNSAIVVMVASLIIALVIFVMDYSFQNLMDIVYRLVY